MCGINFILTQSASATEAAVQKMNAATAHRGPDAKGVHSVTKNGLQYTFGHVRLRVIDNSAAADQPFVSECGNYILIFNGEIYNYQSLKKLLPDIHFKTHSDTEVLLQLLIQYGKEILPRLNGMFAFVFADLQTGNVLCARDASGIKPLYYFQDGNKFIVSSELKGIFASGLVTKELNEKEIPNYLTYRYALKPNTFFKNVFELPEGSLLFYTDKKLTTSTFSTVPDTFSNFNEVLTSAIKSQLVSDVPVGIFLSGGIDSTLLTAISASKLNVKLKCFTIADGTDVNADSDYLAAKEVAEKTGCEFLPLTLYPSVYNEFDNFVAATDQPVADPASLLIWKLSEHAKKHVSVVFNGAGADELFGGYNRHKAFHFYLNYKNALISGSSLVSKFLPAYSPYGKLFSAVNSDAKSTFINFTKLSQQFESEMIRDNNNEFGIAEALNFDRKHYLISDVLAITDKYSMQFGLESRVPYLDNACIDYATNCYTNSLDAIFQKKELKLLLTELGFGTISARSKKGFGINLEKWLLSTEYQELIEKYLLNEKLLLYKYVSLELVKGLLNDYLVRKKNYTQEIWAFCLLSAWLEKEFN